MSKKDSITRIRIILGCCIAVALLLSVKLYFVQIVHGEHYRDEGEGQYVSTSGNLFDRGKVTLEYKDGEPFDAASLKTGLIVAITPDLLTDPEAAYEDLAKLIEVDRDEFMRKAGKVGDPYEVIARRVDYELRDEINALNYEGLRTYRERWRYYPGDSLASHVVGFVSDHDGELSGSYGIEHEYDNVLSRDDNDLYVNFFAEVFGGISSTFQDEDGEEHREGDVVLTIEPVVQRELEETLSDIREQWSSKQTVGIIINPQDGSIYAMAVSPGYDLNNFRHEDPNTFFNPLVEGVYEMGSIIKPLTVAAGLDAGVIAPGTTYNDTGHITLNGRTISNFDGEARGLVSMQEVLSQSLNTGVAFITTKLGKERFTQYVERFGFMEQTGIDLPNEGNNLVDTLKTSTYDVDFATASFGQGPAFTPISTARALAALGNGGYLIDPHVVKKIDYSSGFDTTIEKEKGAQAISPETSETITRMLVEVVDEALLGGTVAIPEYSVAAKTGTAQIAGPGGYYEDRYNHTFFGYFPAYDPEFLILLINFEPQRARYASETLTEGFMDLTEFLINYYSVPPDRAID